MNGTRKGSAIQLAEPFVIQSAGKDDEHDHYNPLNRARRETHETSPVKWVGYISVHPVLVSDAPLHFLSQVAHVFGSTSPRDGSTAITIRHWSDDCSKYIADRLGWTDKTVSRRLADLSRKGLIHYDQANRECTISLPPIEGRQRPQVPKGVALSTRALRVWCTLQLVSRMAPISEVAEQLGVSANTVRRAEAELEAGGFLVRNQEAGRPIARVLPGLVRATYGRGPKSDPEPLPNVAPSPSTRQRSDKRGRPTVERHDGHTARTSQFDRWDLLEHDERAATERGPVGGSGRTGDRLTHRVDQIRARAQRDEETNP